MNSDSAITLDHISKTYFVAVKINQHLLHLQRFIPLPLPHTSDHRGSCWFPRKSHKQSFLNTNTQLNVGDFVLNIT